MKQNLTEGVEIPAGVSCEIKGNDLKCKKGSLELTRVLNNPLIDSKVEGNSIVFSCKAGNKKDFKTIKSMVAHIKNMFAGLEKPFVYRLESCNVHFPMTIKAEKDKLIVSNFLGEKTPRFAKILPGVSVEIKGQKITITSADREAAGQTAANFEKATKIRFRDRRVFQDGIFITESPGKEAAQ